MYVMYAVVGRFTIAEMAIGMTESHSGFCPIVQLKAHNKVRFSQSELRRGTEVPVLEVGYVKNCKISVPQGLILG